MNKSESKYFNTARKMDNAFIELINKKDFEFITVKEICKNAGVNRSTFYLHYETIEDLLSECIELHFKTFESYIKKEYKPINERIKTDSLNDLYFITDEYLNPYLNFIKENKIMFKTVLKHPNVFKTTNTAERIYRNVFEPILERYDVPNTKRKYFVSFYIHAIIGVISEWLNNDCKESIENIIDIIKECSVK